MAWHYIGDTSLHLSMTEHIQPLSLILKKFEFENLDLDIYNPEEIITQDDRDNKIKALSDALTY
jgi:hypothetical protein